MQPSSYFISLHLTPGLQEHLSLRRLMHTVIVHEINNVYFDKHDMACQIYADDTQLYVIVDPSTLVDNIYTRIKSHRMQILED